MTTKKKIHTYCKYKQLKTRERILFSDSEVHVHVNMIKNKILNQGESWWQDFHAVIFTFSSEGGGNHFVT